MARILIGPSDDRCAELAMFVVKGGAKSTLGGGQLELGGRQLAERKAAIGVGFGGCYGLAVLLRQQCQGRAAYRLIGDGVDHDSGDAMCAAGCCRWRGLRQGGETRQRKQGEEGRRGASETAGP